MRRFRLVYILLFFAIRTWCADPPKLLSSVSGPSGKTVGNDFILDETRNRFVYPNDSSLVIYFKWEAPPGDHVLTGIWKRPDGGVGSISPDVKIQTTTTSLNCYWIFELTPRLPNGIWTLEVRIDGQPAGTHPFEIAGMETHSKQPTVDQIFRMVGSSLVWIRKIDENSRKGDPCTGFVIRANGIATAFQCIDSASSLEIEFADGHKIKTDQVLAASRMGDWAIVSADTGALAPLARGNPKQISVGERLLAFNVDSNVRVIGGVDIGGQNVLPSFGSRIQFAPAVVSEAVGGPLLDLLGLVVGVLGGSVTPGTRIEPRLVKTGQGLSSLSSTANSATSISDVPEAQTTQLQSLGQLANAGVLTPAVRPMSEFLYGGTVKTLPRSADEPLPGDTAEFSKRDSAVNVYSFWKREGKIGKGEISAKVYDVGNRLRGAIPPKKITLRNESTRYSFGFAPASLEPGIYRIDLLWDDRPAWRTYIRVAE